MKISFQLAHTSTNGIQRRLIQVLHQQTNVVYTQNQFSYNYLSRCDVCASHQSLIVGNPFKLLALEAYAFLI